MKEVFVAALYVVAAASITRGVELIFAPAAWIVGGLLAAGLTFIVFAETSK